MLKMGQDGELGEQSPASFQDNDKTIPTILDGDSLELETPKLVNSQPCETCGNRPCTCPKPPPELCPVCGQ